jgi:hypothetical protein
MGPVVGGVVVVVAGQSEAKLLALAMSSHDLFSAHVSCSEVGLVLHTWLLQLLFALAASAPHFVNFASQRLAQSAAEAGVLPDEPDVPELPDVPPDDDVPDVVDEQATAASVSAATAANVAYFETREGEE